MVEADDEGWMISKAPGYTHNRLHSRKRGWLEALKYKGLRGRYGYTHAEEMKMGLPEKCGISRDSGEDRLHSL